MTNLIHLDDDVAKLLEMSGARDQILTEYVRKRIREWEAAGKNLRDIEVQNGVRFMSRGYASRVKLGMNGVSSKTMPGFARAFGFKNHLELQSEAHRWAENEGKPALEQFAQPPEGDPGRADAIVFAKGRLGVSELAVKEVLEKFPNIAGKDALWWANRFDEAQRELREREAQAAKDDFDKRRIRRKVAKARKDAPASSRSLPTGEAPTPTTRSETVPGRKAST